MVHCFVAGSDDWSWGRRDQRGPVRDVGALRSEHGTRYQTRRQVLQKVARYVQCTPRHHVLNRILTTGLRENFRGILQCRDSWGCKRFPEDARVLEWRQHWSMNNPLIEEGIKVLNEWIRISAKLYGHSFERPPHFPVYSRNRDLEIHANPMWIQMHP